MKRPKIIVVDDNQTFRQSLILLITIENFANVIGKASNGIEFLNLLVYNKPDLVLMDIDMPEMNGIEATQKALELYPDLKIIAFSMFGNEEYYLKMKELGVKGYLLKSCDIDEFEKALQVVMKGDNYFITHPMKIINDISNVGKMLEEKTENSIAEIKLIEKTYSSN